jgi:hypothetical protein
MNNQSYFWAKMLKFFVQIRDPEEKKFGSEIGMEKIRIRDEKIWVRIRNTASD